MRPSKPVRFATAPTGPDKSGSKPRGENVYLFLEFTIKARGVVEATRVCVIGAWNIHTRAGNKRGPNDGNGVSYRNGVYQSSEISEYASYASASSSISGYNKYGEGY